MDTCSVRLLSDDLSGWWIIMRFSFRHSFSLLHALFYGWAFEMMGHESECSMLLSRNFEVCLLSSVELLGLFA